MSRRTNRETAAALVEPRCLRCNGVLDVGYYHLDKDRCIEILGRRLRDLEERMTQIDGRLPARH